MSDIPVKVELPYATVEAAYIRPGAGRWEVFATMQRLAASKTGAPSAYVLVEWRDDVANSQIVCTLDLREELKSPYLDRSFGS